MRLPLVLGSVLVGAYGVHSTSPPVQVELRSSWKTPPFLVEILETIALEKPGSFIPLLDAVLRPESYSWTEARDNLTESTNTEQIYQFVKEVALESQFLCGEGELASFETSLALHDALPRIEAMYQYYLDTHAAEMRCGGGSWVDWYGEVVCDVQTLRSLVEVEMIDPPESGETHSTSVPHPRLLPFDHIHPSPSMTIDRPPRTAILYASMPPTSFGELHAYLLDVSSPPERQIEYVFRHIPPKGYESSIETEAKTYLSGYGVSLDLKKMDYLALDDRRQGSNSREEFASETSDLPYDTDRILSLVHQYPENVTADYVAPLSEEELLQIGMQSTQLIYDAGEENALATLKQLSQNFPKYVKDVARRVTAEDKLEAEIMDNQVKAQGGISMAWLNGVVIQETDWNPFSLLRLLRKERSTMQSLMSLRLTSEQAIELLTHRAVGVAQADSGVLDGIFDASDRLEGEGAIVWWNDFENDSRYARWGPSLSLLLRPMYPGQLPNLKLNIFNVVVVADLSQSSALNFIAGAVSNIIQRNFPFRWGIVPIIETEEGERMARLFYWLVENLGQTKTMEFIARISQVQTPVHLITPTVDWSLVHSEFHHAISERLDNDEVSDHFPRHIDLELILSGSVGDSAEVLQKARTYAKRLSADLASAPQGHTFLNGKHFNLDDDFLRNMQVEAGQQLLHLQEQLYHGLLTPEDGARISTYFYDRPEASKRRSKHIYPSGKPEGLKILSLTDLILHSRGSFVYPPESEGHNLPLTTFVVTDLDSTAGAELVKEVLSAMEDSTTRVAFIHNPSTKGANTNPSPGLSGLLRNLGNKGLLHGITPSRLLDVLRSGSVGPSKTIDQVVLSAEGLSDDALREALLPDMTEETEDYQQFVEASRFVLRDLKIGPGEQVVIMNGRVVGPLGRGEFVAEDFQELVAYEYRKRVGPVVDALADILPALDELDRIDYADFVSSVSSVISSIHLPDPSESGLFNAPIKPRRRNYQLLAGEYTKFEYGDNSTAFFHVGILLDPLSEAAQKWSSLLEWLLDDPAVFVELHINPARYKEMPLKRFYRYSVSPKINFDENGEEIPSKLTFHGLPEEPIYTLAMDVAPSWLVRPREALYDLDNILLSALSNHERAKGIQAIFDLDYLVIEGHARQVFTNSPPRGLQMQLVANSTPIADTLVVANLGYLQFRTKPGVFRLEIRPGRGREIFHMESVGNEGWDSPSVAEVGNEVTLMSFEGLTLYPRVTRFPGMEGVDVLATESVPGEDEGLFGKVKESISSLFSTKSTEVAVAEPNDDQAEINIFTVASGLLYERFASIMILSVLRNTKSTVKFWFIENFLSPSFLEFIPHFAKEYGFQYELVTYKWPSWLRAQKEKQRIIWAYKILFLDVLFPMDLKKVIFVDADQIVRADLKELVDLDIHGAPYAYTPMGDDNVEMEGFRFWKTGYWKDFLGEMPYHISALYVVDLVRFRQMAAGDILRSHYQHLSADPGSLANLDQDLPNNLQREVPIFSLPEDWLWCETWCSKDRLHRAKTIDLCQNPLTKEPKLARAKHIPEWEEYDAEVARLARLLAEDGIIHSGMAVADANILADVGAGPVVHEVTQEHPELDESSHTEGRPKDEL